MGNTPAKDQRENIYAAYIQQQHDLINQQQHQINSLYQLNLQNQYNATMSQGNQQGSSQGNLQGSSQGNLQGSSQGNLQGNQQGSSQGNLQGSSRSNYNMNFQKPQSETDILMIESKKQQLDPYQILNLPKDYNEKQLKKAYLKAATKTHPDRGGSKKDFQKVSIAYTLLKRKLKESQNNHSHNDLRDMSREYAKDQMNNPRINTQMSDNFDINLFNKIYEENKINDAYDDGYGDWMNENPAEETGKMFQNGFNKDLFNHTFENYKKEKMSAKGQQLVKTDPQTRISLKNQDSLMVLGQGKIDNFSGEVSDLGFTDYKHAFTDGSCLISAHSVDITDRSQSINGIKRERSNISYTMNQQDEQRMALQMAQDQKSEEARLRRLQQFDKKSGENYEKIHSLLLR